MSISSDLQNHHLGMILLEMEMTRLKKRIRKLIMKQKEFIHLQISLFLFFSVSQVRKMLLFYHLDLSVVPIIFPARTSVCDLLKADFLIDMHRQKVPPR